MGIDAPRRCFTHDRTKDGKLKRAASRIAACRVVAIENRNGYEVADARHSEIAFYYVCYVNSEVFALTPDPLAGKYYSRTGHPRSFFAKLTKS